MLWINFLHLYQPANASDHHIKEATEKSYKRIIKGLEENPTIKFTLNISGCLLERWQDSGYEDIIIRIKNLLQRGQIEITGTLAFHAFSPLIPENELINQVKENEAILKKFFDYKPKGFFFPEMAYSQKAGRIVKNLGYAWAILDDIVFPKEKKLDNEKKYIDQSGLNIIFRSRKLSNTYTPETIKKLISKRDSQIAITASDAEIYGLRHEDPRRIFEMILKNTKLKTSLISDFLKGLQDAEKISVSEGTWSTSLKELKADKPFFVWHNPKNKIQESLWQFAYMSIDINNKYADDKNYHWSRWHLVRGLASCAFWWASDRNFKEVFGPIAWNPDEIEKGINDLIRSIRSLEKLSKKEKIEAEKFAAKIKLMVWQKHWLKHSLN